MVRCSVSTPSSAEFRGPLLPEKLPGLLDELVELANEIVDRGDIP